MTWLMGLNYHDHQLCLVKLIYARGSWPIHKFSEFDDATWQVLVKKEVGWNWTLNLLAESTSWTPPQPRLKKAESFLFYIPLYPDIVTEPFTIFFTMYHNDTFSFYVYRLSFTMRFHFFHFLDEGFDLILDYENKFFFSFQSFLVKSLLVILLLCLKSS